MAIPLASCYHDSKGSAMGATALILLILFLIGLGVALYYVVVCFQSRPKSEKSRIYPDMGPLLAHDPDFNGNHEDVPVQPVRYIDQPDSGKVNDESAVDFSNKEKELERPLKSVTFHSTPECASKNPTQDTVFSSIDEPTLNNSKPLASATHQDGRPQNENELPMGYTNDRELHSIIVMPPVSSNTPKTLSDSYEEDGLLVPRRTPPPQHNLSNLPIIVPMIQKDPEYVSAPSNTFQPTQENYPGKHVRFISPYINQPCIVETIPVQAEEPQNSLFEDDSTNVDAFNSHPVENVVKIINEVDMYKNSVSPKYPLEQPIQRNSSTEEVDEVFTKELGGKNHSDRYSDRAPVIPPMSITLPLATQTPMEVSKSEEELSEKSLSDSSSDLRLVDKPTNESIQDSPSEDYAENVPIVDKPDSPVLGWAIPCFKEPAKVCNEKENNGALPPAVKPEVTVICGTDNLALEKDETLESAPATVVKVLFPSDENEKISLTPSSNESLSSGDESDTESSDPDVTEYSFQSGHLVPSTAMVLANEVSFYSDPKVGLTSFVSRTDSPPQNIPTPDPDKGQLLTPSSESNPSSSPPRINDTSLIEENSVPLNKPLIILPGTPPVTPPTPIEMEDSPTFMLGNTSSPNSETTPAFIILDTHNNLQRSPSISSTSSSSSSSSSNGSYKIQNVKEKLERSAMLSEDNSKIPRLKK